VYAMEDYDVALCSGNVFVTNGCYGRDG